MKQKPFIFGVATSGDNFTDRKEETKRLLLNFQYGVNTILISPRRWGKTSLVKKVIDLAESNKLKPVYVDIYSCKNEKDFCNALASAVIRQTSSKIEDWLENTKEFLSRINPKISLGAFPMSDFSLSLNLNAKDKDLEEILQLPEKIAARKNIDIVICIDEFQQITEFKDSKTFQKILRSFWQLQEHTSYCLFGSKKHIMNELFEKKSLPFYKFGDIINLNKISTENWVVYICGQFEHTGRHISKEMAQEICRTAENHSSYVQQLAWLVWTKTDSEATGQSLEAAIQDLIDQNTPLYEKQIENLTGYQMNYLKAMLNGDTDRLSMQQLIEDYDLKSSANIAAIKKALTKKEIIDTENKTYIISDPIMKLWLKRVFNM